MLIGSILWAYLSVLFEIVADTVEWERWEGTIEYTFMAPAHRATHLLSTCGFSVAYGLARSLLLLLAISAFFSIDLRQADLIAAGVVLAVASISFIGFGMVASVLPLGLFIFGRFERHALKTGRLKRSG